jgi:phospholipase/carboxylesterase
MMPSALGHSVNQNLGLLGVNPVESLGPGDRLLVLLHGFGADENDLAPIVQHIDPDGRFTSVCFRAPIDLIPFGAAWYERNNEGVIDAQTFKNSVIAIGATIDAVCETGGFDRAEMILLGFSQGCAMALAVGLWKGTAVRPAGLACLSGMLQEIRDFEYDFTALPATFIQHGTQDPMVDVERGRHIRDVLVASGHSPDYSEYPMGHEISAASLFDLRDWLATV